MFGKSDLVDSLGRALARARDKRDALASDVTTLTAQIAELEARLSAENDRRERERAAGEIERIKTQVRNHYLAFAPVIAGIRDATEVAVAVVPEACEFNDLLEVIATEVANAIDGLMGDLDQRVEAVRAGYAAPELSQPFNKSSELPQNSNRIFHLPEWLAHRKPTKEPAEDWCGTAAA